MKKETQPIFSRKDLLDKGWSDSLIKKWLSTPDVLKTNPMYRSAAPMKFWYQEKIKIIEQIPEFLSNKEKYLKTKDVRKEAAQKAIKTKERKLLKEIDNWNPEIYLPKNITTKELIILALEAQGELQIERKNNFGFYINPKNHSVENLVRWTENYIRHQCCNYDFNFSGKSGCSENHDLIRERINKIVHKRWPDLFAIANKLIHDKDK